MADRTPAAPAIALGWLPWRPGAPRRPSPAPAPAAAAALARHRPPCTPTQRPVYSGVSQLLCPHSHAPNALLPATHARSGAGTDVVVVVVVDPCMARLHYYMFVQGRRTVISKSLAIHLLLAAAALYAASSSV